MQIAIYAPHNEGEARRIVDNLLSGGVCANVCLHTKKEDFLRQLCTPDQYPDSCILTPYSKSDLVDLSSIKDLMSRTLRIILLPNHDPMLRAYAHSFRPCLLLSHNESPDLITSILLNLDKKNELSRLIPDLSRKDARQVSARE
jgi:hypothetical protein